MNKPTLPIKPVLRNHKITSVGVKYEMRVGQLLIIKTNHNLKLELIDF